MHLFFNENVFILIKIVLDIVP